MFCVLYFSVQDVFRWKMEVVEEGYDFRDTGRVVWSIEYQRDGLASETYTAQESKVVSQINIRSKDQQRLVPVLKVSEEINNVSKAPPPKKLYVSGNPTLPIKTPPRTKKDH